VRILVVDRATRAPLPGMSVQITGGPIVLVADPSSSTLSWTGPILRTDATGHAEVERDAHSRDVHVRAWDPFGDKGSAIRELLLPHEIGDEDIVLELSPANDLDFWVRVVDAQTLEPIAGAYNTEWIPFELPTEELPPRWTFPTGPKPSGADGLLHFTGPTWAKQTLRLSIPGHAGIVVHPEEGHEEAAKAFVVTTGRHATVRLHITDLDGLPLAGAIVGLGTKSRRQMRPIPDNPNEVTFYSHWSMVTDANGRVVLAELPPDVPLEPVGATFGTKKMAELVLEPGEVRDVEWRVDGGTLRGIVLDQHDEPVADCELWLKRCLVARPDYFDAQDSYQLERRVETDAGGRFAIPMIHGGKWWLGPGLVRPGAQEIAPFAQVVEENGGRLTQDLVLRVDRGLFIAGRVSPPTGEALMAGTIVVEDRERRLSMSAPWNADGTFVVGPLMSGRCYVTAVSASGHAPSRDALVEAGARDVELSLRAGATIRGRLLDENGALAQGTIRLNQREADSSGKCVQWTHTSGEFELKSVAAGRYALAATSNTRTVALLDPVVVAEGSGPVDVVLQLSPGGMVSVAYVGLERMGDVSVLKDGVEYSSGKMERSSPNLLFAPPGKVNVRLRIEDTGRVLERTVDVAPGPPTKVTFERDAR
jgi:hypothetical protein